MTNFTEVQSPDKDAEVQSLSIKNDNSTEAQSPYKDAEAQSPSIRDDKSTEALRVK